MQKSWFSFVKKNQTALSTEKFRLAKPRPENVHEYLWSFFIHLEQSSLQKKKEQNTKSERREEVERKGRREGAREGWREGKKVGGRESGGENFRVLWSDLPPFKPSPMKTSPCWSLSCWLHRCTLECSHIRRDRLCTMGSPRVTSFSHIPTPWSSPGVLGRALALGHPVTGTCLAQNCLKHICYVRIWSHFFPVQPLETDMGGLALWGRPPLNRRQMPDLEFAPWAVSMLSANWFSCCPQPHAL